MIEWKEFATSTSKIVSIDSYLKFFSISCKAASDPTSSPAHTCSDPADEATSFLSAETLTFPVIL